MTDPKIYTAIGLMSGTSRDGIDAALVRTDGGAHVEEGAALTSPYDDAMRARLEAAGKAARGREGKDRDPELDALERDLTLLHAQAVRDLMERAALAPQDVDAVGLHGHTLVHRPDKGFSWQIGDAALLARELSIRVVADLRGDDLRAGGQGAPLAPVYHHARLTGATGHEVVAVLNIGGVANVTWVDLSEAAEPAMLAFDTGPGNALLDDWARAETGKPFDEGGRLAAGGEIHSEIVAAMMDHPYFDQPPPKSLDRDGFPAEGARGLRPADGAGTLAAFTVESIVAAQMHFPKPARAWYVSGGGRHNPVLMTGLARRLPAPVAPVESLGWRGDVLEAELFAYLAVRHLTARPVTYPTTTGAPAPMTGGTVFEP